jgi:hypothetical protein
MPLTAPTIKTQVAARIHSGQSSVVVRELSEFLNGLQGPPHKQWDRCRAMIEPFSRVRCFSPDRVHGSVQNNRASYYSSNVKHWPVLRCPCRAIEHIFKLINGIERLRPSGSRNTAPSQCHLSWPGSVGDPPHHIIDRFKWPGVETPLQFPRHLCGPRRHPR